MTLPCRWDEGGLADFAGRVRFTRRFGLPTNLDLTEQVWLVFEGADGTTSVTLNAQLLGVHSAAEPFEFEITRCCSARELHVEVSRPARRRCG